VSKVNHYKLALLGFGNVGKCLAQLLLQKEAELLEKFQLTFTITGIYTLHHGVVILPEGIDLRKALSCHNLSEFSNQKNQYNSFEFIQHCGADVLFENSPVNYGNGQPAVSHIRTALELGMHVVTANKGPVVHEYHSLTRLAQVKGKHFFFESAVMDGCPIFSLFRETLPSVQLIRFKGVLNSTTNLILTRMETGDSFEQAVAYCQEIGIAETDPSGDIDGWDTSVKVAALITVLMDTPFKPQQVQREGIRSITSEKVLQAKETRKRWKLVCSAERFADHILASVSPELVNEGSTFYNLDGTSSLIQFETDVLGKLSILEENPGPHTTAYGCLADFINAVMK
jgi:homoserine dehydrogenase